jgi:hypothetical protein
MKAAGQARLDSASAFVAQTSNPRYDARGGFAQKKGPVGLLKREFQQKEVDRKNQVFINALFKGRYIQIMKTQRVCKVMSGPRFYVEAVRAIFFHSSTNQISRSPCPK